MEQTETASSIATDEALLAEYLRDRSNAIFAQIVQRNAELVYSAARRQLADANLAEDVSQAVFILLAKKGSSVRGSVAGWLVKATYFTCRNIRKINARREFHERRASQMKLETTETTDEPAWDRISPSIDLAMNKLSQADRDAIVLRFLRSKTLREVGEAMGISEEAARKRVDRGIDRLRNILAGRAVAPATAAGLATLLAARGAQAAPMGFAQKLAGVFANATTHSQAVTIAKATARAMTMAKLKIAAIILAGAAVTVPGAIGIARLLTAGPTTAPVPASVAPPQTVAVIPAASTPDIFSQNDEQSIIARFNAEADLKCGGPVVAPPTDQTFDTPTGPTKGVFTRMVTIAFEHGHAALLTCADAGAAKSLRGELAQQPDIGLSFLQGRIVVVITGDPADRLAAARAVHDDAGFQFIDLLEHRGWELKDIRLQTPSKVLAKQRRVGVSVKIDQVTNAGFAKGDDKIEITAIHTDASQAAMNEYISLEPNRYRAWDQTVISATVGHDQPAPIAYGPENTDRLPGQLLRLSLRGVKVNSLDLIPVDKLDALGAGAQSAVAETVDLNCDVEGKPLEMRVYQTEPGTPPEAVQTALKSAGGDSNRVLVRGNLTFESVNGPIPSSLAEKLSELF